jgi:sigma-B regulation protein RsbQ
MDVATRNNVVITGRDDGPVIMLANGFGCDQNMWRLVAPQLARDFKVVQFDHVGTGRADVSSWSEERYSSLDAYAEDLLAICDDLRLGPLVLVGHSVSAVIAVLAVAWRPDLFEKLILLTPSPRYIDDAGYRGGFSAEDIDELLESLESNYLGWSQSLAPVVMGDTGRPELTEELTNSFCRLDPEIARVFARATFLSDNRGDLGRVTVPTRVIEVAQDVIAPREVGAFVHESIRGSDRVTLDAVGHCPQLSSPEPTARAIAEFAASDR